MYLLLSNHIESDLEAIADYIAQDNPTRALSFIRQIRDQLRLIGQNPLLYQLRPDIGKDARVAVFGRYVILFRILEETVRIERVVFGDAIFQLSINRLIRAKKSRRKIRNRPASAFR